MQEDSKNLVQQDENLNALSSAWEDVSSPSDKSLISQASPLPEISLTSDKISTPPKVTASTQPRHRWTNWQIMLLSVAIVAVIASGARLWYIITSPSTPSYSTIPATAQDNPASAAQVNSPTLTTPTAGANTSLSTPPTSYEAESVWNTLANGAAVLKCSSCSGGEKVGYIGEDYVTNTKGTLQFNNIYKNSSGNYILTIYYLLAGLDSPTGYMSVNGGPATAFTVPITANANTVGTFNTMISLNTGNNTIEFSNPSVDAPDIDRIAV